MIYFYIKGENAISSTNDEQYLPNEAILLDEEKYQEYKSKIKNGYKAEFSVLDNSVIITYTLKENWENTLKERKLKQLRNKRKPLLEAFDKYKSNVNYGVVTETETTREVIVTWYQGLLNLVESAFEDEYIPSQIKYYL